LSTLTIFAGCIAIWGTTWLAITFQLGSVPVEASVAYRFILAAAFLFAYCYARRLPLRFTQSEHAILALLGVLMYSIGYLFVYRAEMHVASGLVAIGYSASPLLAMFGMRIAFGQAMTSAHGSWRRARDRRPSRSFIGPSWNMRSTVATSCWAPPLPLGLCS
jgi:drug/metabolite transporter (DMT)-like permease